MAIYHLNVKIVSRSEGRSVVGAAAYRSAEQIHDQRIGLTFDYRRKAGVAYTEILAPKGAPAWVGDRSVLWNTVEQVEKRKDAQLAREVEIALPVELSEREQIALLRDFAQRVFVSNGMVADIALHRDNHENPHAHILLTTRELTANGFGAKRRDWNDRAQLLSWREQWAQIANEHLQRADHDIRIDHRTLDAQGIDLVPGVKLGLSADRRAQAALPRNLAERVAQQRAIAAENGRRILENPGIALQALTHHQATFTHADVAKYLHGRTDGLEQFQAAYLKVTTSPEIVKLGRDERGGLRFTTREMVQTERATLDRAQRMAGSCRHVVSVPHQNQVLADGRLSTQQRGAFEHLVGGSDLAVLFGVAGAGKSTMLEAARRTWEAQGFSVKGGALAGIAAENLEIASGIQARTLASWERSWDQGYELLGSHDVLVIDEAGLIGTRQLARILERAEASGAKVVLVGDPEQLQPIEAGTPFRGIAARTGAAELTEVRRQKQTWQRQATKQLSAGRTSEALAAYERRGWVSAAPTRQEARTALLAAWERAGRQQRGKSRLMLAYTRDDVQRLNEQARAARVAIGELGKGEIIETERGMREISVGDRLYFLKNERSLGVKNGSLGTVEKIRHGVIQVRLDGEEARRVVVDTAQYQHLDHGYAATVHKAQGVTVDQTYVLATPHFDRHSTYVALSRHRDDVAMFYGDEDFCSAWEPTSAQARFYAVLSRAMPKELAHDYLEGDAESAKPPERPPMSAGDREGYVNQVKSEALAAWRSFRAKQQRSVAPVRDKQRKLDRSRKLRREAARDEDVTARVGGSPAYARTQNRRYRVTNKPSF